MKKAWSCTIIAAPNMDDVYATIEDLVDETEDILTSFRVVDTPALGAYLVTCVFIRNECRDA
jgi:hypothetical protein